MEICRILDTDAWNIVCNFGINPMQCPEGLLQRTEEPPVWVSDIPSTSWSFDQTITSMVQKWCKTQPGPHGDYFYMLCTAAQNNTLQREDNEICCTLIWSF